MELDGMGGSMMIESSKGKKKSNEVEYSDLTQDALEGMMSTDISKLTELFGFSVSHISFRLILRVISRLHRIREMNV